jgi:hypothetical protein
MSANDTQMRLSAYFQTAKPLEKNPSGFRTIMCKVHPFLTMKIEQSGGGKSVHHKPQLS